METAERWRCRQGHVKQVVEQVTEEGHGVAVNEKKWVQIAPSPTGPMLLSRFTFLAHKTCIRELWEQKERTSENTEDMPGRCYVPST
jgi:hypothetical protein